MNKWNRFVVIWLSFKCLLSEEWENGVTLAERVYCEMHTVWRSPYCECWQSLRRISVFAEEAEPETGRSDLLLHAQEEKGLHCCPIEWRQQGVNTSLPVSFSHRSPWQPSDSGGTQAYTTPPPFLHPPMISLSRSLNLSPHLSLLPFWHNFSISLMFSPAHGWLMWRCSLGWQVSQAVFFYAEVSIPEQLKVGPVLDPIKEALVPLSVISAHVTINY